MGKKAKPRSPAEILAEAAERRRQAFAAVGLSPEMADLVTNADIDITRKAEQREGGKTVEDNSARRLDAFEALRSGMDKGCYDAAKRLERDILTRRGEGDKGRILERVDGQSAKDRTDLMVDAACTCDALADKLSKREWWLLNELIAQTLVLDGWTPEWMDGDEFKRGETQYGWRAVVGYITGETNDRAQAARVRGAVSNLRDAYEDLEQERAGQKRKAA